ncbi:hypothetical protein CTI12_AA126870 [Artemisia annua]|uniref:Uncharacterized protein n=1 Tax=Artemisia annua TaxID=35608 RepID=A0A2U1PM33_ARTAN|nr:hypothetical protein CTI12_AA126870 [Artemisia annua]
MYGNAIEGLASILACMGWVQKEMRRSWWFPMVQRLATEGETAYAPFVQQLMRPFIKVLLMSHGHEAFKMPSAFEAAVTNE